MFSAEGIRRLCVTFCILLLLSEQESPIADSRVNRRRGTYMIYSAERIPYLVSL